MSNVPYLAFAAICYFFPRATLEWAVASILAFILAYMTVQTHGIAPLHPFALWWIADYIVLQLIFSLFNRKVRPLATTFANDNGARHA